MGLFGGSSKSSSKTYYTDNSTNVSADLSSGDLGGGATDNIIAGGDVYQEGISEDLFATVFDKVNASYDKALNWVSNSIGTQQANVNQVTQALTNAYNSEQATISSFKTYALYGLVGFISWAYFKGK